MKLFIDFCTGTWGEASSIVIFDADEEGMLMDNDGGDSATVISYLDNASDSEIMALGFEVYQRQFKDA